MCEIFVVAGHCEINLILSFQKLQMQVNIGYVYVGGNLDKQYASVATYLFYYFNYYVTIGLPELNMAISLDHSSPEVAIILATLTLCHANNDCGFTSLYRLLLNMLFVVCSITILLLIW